MKDPDWADCLGGIVVILTVLWLGAQMWGLLLG